MIRSLLILVFLFYPTTDKIHRIPTSFIDIKRNLKEGNDFTLIYLFKPSCQPSVHNLSKLQEIKRDYNFNVILLTTAKENVELLKKYDFDTCHYFNPLIYKTHTLDFDEYDQFTNEVFTDANIIEPSYRIRFPAVFIYNRKRKLIYYNEDENSTVLDFHKIISLKQ